MINRRSITETISKIVGQIIGLALLLAVAIFVLLLIPGLATISWINDLSGNQISTLELWLGALIISSALYGLIRFLIKDPDVSWKVYGGLCISVLILCITLSIRFQQHFGQRWARRLMNFPFLSQVFPESNKAYVQKPEIVERNSINRITMSALDFPSSGDLGCQRL